MGCYESLKVSDFLLTERNWDMDVINNLVPNYIALDIVNVFLSNSILLDKIVWGSYS